MEITAGRCRFPNGPDSVCGAPVPPRPGPGRPAAYCADPTHNAVRAHRAAKRYADAAELPVSQSDAEHLAAELERARGTIAAAERARHGAEREAHEFHTGRGHDERSGHRPVGGWVSRCVRRYFSSFASIQLPTASMSSAGMARV